MLARINHNPTMHLEETVKNLFVLMDMEQFLNMHVEDLTRH